MSDMKKYLGDLESEPVAPFADPVELFSITQVIGKVYSGDGDNSPRVTAFMIIAEAGVGEFQFPNENGTVCTVNVSHSEFAE